MTYDEFTDDLGLLTNNWVYYRQKIKQLLENKKFKSGERRGVYFMFSGNL
jgi:hypothetical protein